VCSGEASNQISYEGFRNDLKDHLDSAIAKGTVTSAGIFFRDLHNGPLLTINSADSFIPMSLMKMPLMIAILKYSEVHPEVLSEKVRTPKEFAANVQVMDKGETIAPDHEYTVDELLSFMISYSDNRALGVLGSWFDGKAGRGSVINTLVDLGLMRRQDVLPDATVSPRTYGSILRVLYSGAYLNLETSQKALELLTETKFHDGLTHDVPGGVRVAHKFGVLDNGNGEVQLHDCGIVYHPAGPYILCVMTKGTDYDRQASYIQDVASRVYDHVTQESSRK
jgi:beta-lactamase class A